MILAAAILLFLIASGVLGLALCRVAARGDRQTVYIAKCPEHGLHGELGQRPNSATLASPCVERGRVQQIVWSALDPSEATVICRDGTVHEVRRP